MHVHIPLEGLQESLRESLQDAGPPIAANRSLGLVVVGLPPTRETSNIGLPGTLGFQETLESQWFTHVLGAGILSCLKKLRC